MKGLEAVWKGTEKVVDIFAVVCAITCLINMVLLFVDIFLRYAFKTSLPGATEYATVILMFVAYFGIAYTHREHRHMEMGALYEKFGPQMKKIMDIIICCVIIFVFLMLTYSGWTGFVKSFQTKEVMQAAVPVYRWPGRLGIVLGSALFLFRTVLELIRLIAGTNVIGNAEEKNMDTEEKRERGEVDQ